MLSCAILVHAFYPPSPAAAPVASVSVDVDSTVKAEVARRVDEAVRSAVAQATAQTAASQEKRTAELVAATEKRLREEHEEAIVAASESFRVLNERLSFYTKQMQLASLEVRGAQ